MRELTDLVDSKEPGMVVVRSWIAAANKQVDVLPCDAAAGQKTLLALQVTTRSPMGAVAYETGGLLVDGGWLRILGAGNLRLPRGLADWNGYPDGPHRLAQALLVGDDAVGGFFALNGGAFDGPLHHIFYLAPDTLRWEDTGDGYSAWLHWAVTGDLADYYLDARWPGWEAEVGTLAGDQALSIVPWLFLDGPPRAERSRRAVPIEELWGLFAIELPRQLNGGGS